MAEDAVQSGDAYIVQAPYLIAHRFRGHRGLFRDGNVGGARTHDGDVARKRFRWRHHNGDGTGIDMMDRIRMGREDGLNNFLGTPGDQYIAAMIAHALYNFDNLRAGFSFGVHRFGVALAQVTMVIQLGETEVLKGKRPQAFRCFVGRSSPVRDGFEKLG
jgi:hypothetical protein